MEDYNDSIQNFTEFWVNVKGLRTKSFTSIEGTNIGTGIYLFKSKASMDAYLKSDLWLSMGNFNHLSDQKVQVYKVLDGGWSCTEINNWP